MKILSIRPSAKNGKIICDIRIKGQVLLAVSMIERKDGSGFYPDLKEIQRRMVQRMVETFDVWIFHDDQMSEENPNGDRLLYYPSFDAMDRAHPIQFDGMYWHRKGVKINGKIHLLDERGEIEFQK